MKQIALCPLGAGLLGAALLGMAVSADANDTEGATAATITLSGSVSDRDGRPVEGAAVSLRALPTRFEEGLRALHDGPEPEPVASCRSGPEGRFAVTAPAVGLWRVAVSRPGFVPSELTPLAVTGDSELGAAVLEPDDHASFTVLGADGEPVAGALVQVVGSEGSVLRGARSGWRIRPRNAISGSLGRVEVPRLGQERLEVVVSKQGFRTTHVRGTTGETIRMDPPQDLQVFEIEVLSADRQPVEEALVIGEAGWPPLGVTDPRGRLRLLDNAHPAGKRIRILTREGHQQSERIAEPPRADRPVPRILQLAPRIEVRGRILDPRTRGGLPGAVVWTGLEPASFARTDGEGRYRLTVPAGTRLWIQAEKEGHVPQTAWIEREDSATGRIPALLE